MGKKNIDLVTRCDASRGRKSKAGGGGIIKGYRIILPKLKKTQVFHRIVQIGLYFTNERHFEGKLGFLELLSIKFESFSQ